MFHVDDSVPDNSNEAHPLVCLVQADGLKHLELAANHGDSGDPYPGRSRKKALTPTTNPNSHAYGGIVSSVAITEITRSQKVMTCRVTVK